MSDISDQDIPLFTPVPSASKRRDGWTPERQARFIAALAAIGTVAGAARAVGMSAWSAYKLRDRAGAEGFARAWDIAQQMPGDRVYEQAIDRAINGVETSRYYRGRQVGTVRRPDFRLAFKVLDHHLANSSAAGVDLNAIRFTDEHDE